MRLAVLILAAVVALAGTAFAAVVLLTRRARRRRDADAQTRAEDRGACGAALTTCDRTDDPPRGHRVMNPPAFLAALEAGLRLHAAPCSRAELQAFAADC